MEELRKHAALEVLVGHALTTGRVGFGASLLCVEGIESGHETRALHHWC